MKKCFFFISMVVLAAITVSCKDSFAEEQMSNYDNEPELVIAVAGDDAASTRAVYSGLSSTMETGDEIGIYAWNGTTVISSNIKFTRQSDGTWTPASKVPYNASYTYCAYFPYRSDHGYTPATSGTVDARFSTFIADASNKFWAADQSTKAKFTSANLCIGQGTHVGSGNRVTFSLDHKRGLAVFEGDGLNEHSFTTNLPYAITSTRKMFLMKPSTSTTIGGYSLSAASGKYVSQNIPWNYTNYTLTLVGPDAYTYQGGTKNYSVTSYVTSAGGGSSMAVAWTAQYSTDGGTTYSSTKPSWLTTFTASGSGGTSADSKSATVAAQSAVIGTASDTYAARSCVVKISQSGGLQKTFTITQNAFTDTYTYYLTVTGPAAYTYQGGTKTYSVTSYKQNANRTTNVAWTATYSSTENGTYNSTKPSWITAFTASGTGGTSATSYNCTVAAQTPTSTAATDVYDARSYWVKISQNEGSRTSKFQVSQTAFTDNKTVPDNVTIPDWTN